MQTQESETMIGFFLVRGDGEPEYKRMPALPRVGQTVYINGPSYRVVEIEWDGDEGEGMAYVYVEVI